MVGELALKEAASVDRQIHAETEPLASADNHVRGRGLTTLSLDVCLYFFKFLFHVFEFIASMYLSGAMS